MNAEESCARGATIMCAILSPTFEFNEFKIEDTHQFSDSIIFNCMHCSQYVIKKEFVNLPSAIKVICGNCPLSVIETGDFERKNCALFDRSSIFCFICRKSGYDIKLNKTYHIDQIHRKKFPFFSPIHIAIFCANRINLTFFIFMKNLIIYTKIQKFFCSIRFK